MQTNYNRCNRQPFRPAIFTIITYSLACKKHKKSFYS